ncbi:MAG: GGDEF domain-containing protein, partial [Acidocella sp.]|nr:GGDEF domain-containing protein [Acidocella sp.]
MPTEYDRTLLPLIDQALASPGWLPPVPRALRRDYAAERLLQCRQFNRRLLVAFTLLFDLYWLNQIWTAPEVVSLSGLLRFGLMTPAVLLFTALDRNDRLGRYYAPILLVLTVAPSVITAVLCVRAASHLALLDIRATPLILLGTSTAVRMPPREFFLNTIITPAVFIASLLFCRVLPQTDLVSLSLIEISIAAAAAGFNMQLEWRDRRMFLLNVAEQIMRGCLAAANQGLVRETLTDPLTGIANRRCFDDTLAHVWHRGAAARTPVGLIMADIDYFKAYNDLYGHLGGDDCLRRVAACMAGLIREEDMLARYGGEEFAIILPDASVDIVMAVAERVRAGVEALRLEHAGLNPPGIVTLSLGLASLQPGGGISVRDLVAMADTDLYGAKRGG